MKAFTVCTALFLILTILVVGFSVHAGRKVEHFQKRAERAALCVLSNENDRALELFTSIKEEWDKLYVPLLLTIHHSTLKPIELSLADAQSAVALDNRDSFYEALVRLSAHLASLSDDLMRPAL